VSSVKDAVSNDLVHPVFDAAQLNFKKPGAVIVQTKIPSSQHPLGRSEMGQMYDVRCHKVSGRFWRVGFFVRYITVGYVT